MKYYYYVRVAAAAAAAVAGKQESIPGVLFRMKNGFFNVLLFLNPLISKLNCK